jgi:hypothetical protein
LEESDEVQNMYCGDKREFWTKHCKEMKALGLNKEPTDFIFTKFLNLAMETAKIQKAFIRGTSDKKESDKFEETLLVALEGAQEDPCKLTKRERKKLLDAVRNLDKTFKVRSTRPHRMVRQSALKFSFIIPFFLPLAY